MEQPTPQHFQLKSFIAEGGMGAVYRGLDSQSGKSVAIKQLRPELTTPQMIERFEREGDILRRLDHPNIVKLLATYSEGDNHYLVMEYVSGGSLRDLLYSEKRLPISRTLEIALELADALARTHHLKIIHRDLKPENVLLSDDGTPRLTDFGISRSELASTLTDSGMLSGTLPYLPPEAFSQESLDARSDLWAFGIMLFEMLTGTRPFDRSSLGGILSAIRQDPIPDLQALVPDIPVALEDTICRLLEKDRLARLPNARLLAAELQAILEGIDVSDYVGPRSKDVLQAIHQSLGAIPTPSAARSNLPAQSTPFVGRDDELSQVKEMLGTVREISVIAPGGMGKTRFAIECAAAQIEEFTDGVYFVALAPLTDPDQIVTTTASAIGLQTSGNQDPKERVLSYLRDKHILLVMDNFEHILDGATFVSDLLNAAPNVKVVATSRERLNIEGETIFRLEGMDVPDWKTLEEAAEYSAVKLFVQSAKRVQPEFELTIDVLPSVAQICRLVAGLPLGIVLAAAWSDTLSPIEIAQEIERSIDFLETERRDVPTRQRSIRAVFDYSWQLLTAEEQTIFKQLSVFHGGFTREAAQAVTNASLRTLQALVNKSMLRRTPEGRFELHDLLQRYAAEQLADSPQEQQTMQEKHCIYFADFLKQREDLSPLAPDIQPEMPNIKAMVEYAVKQKKDDVIKKVNPMLWWTFVGLYWRTDGIAFLTQLLETIPQTDELLWAQLAMHVAGLYYSAYAYKQAGLLFSRCLPIFQRHNYLRGLADVLTTAFTFESDPVKLQQLVAESIPIYRQLGHDRALYSALYILVQANLHLGDTIRAEAILREMESLGLANDGKPDWLHWKKGWHHWRSEFERLRGNFAAAKQHRQAAKALTPAPTSPYDKLTEQGEQLKAEGNYLKAEQNFRDALTVAQKVEDQFDISHSLIALAFVLWRQGRVVEARQCALEALNVSQEGEQSLLSWRSSCFSTLGHFTVLLDQDVEASGYYQQALDIALRQKNLQNDILQTILGFATLLGKRQTEAERIHAVELLSFVRSNPHNEGVLDETDPTGLYEVGVPQWERLQTELSPEVFAAAVERGKTLNYDDVIAEFAEQP